MLTLGHPACDLPAETADWSTITQIYEGTNLGAAERMALRMRLLRRKLMADNKLVEIRGHHAAGWEGVQELRAHREGVLEMECLLSTADPRKLLQDTAEGYAEALLDHLAFLTGSDATDIAWGTTADWLAECPLDFRTAMP